MKYPKLTESERLARLQLPASGKLRMVLDTDTYNEIDDQFALAYAMLSPERLRVEAVYAAPFHNERSSGPGDGMRKSYDEICRVLKRLGVAPKGLVFKGSPQWMKDAETPVKSDAARDLVKKARTATEKNPLYVLGIGAPTNIASAILIAPEIIRKIVVVWLGGQPLHWNSAAEFNLQQNPHATRVLLDSGVPLVVIPCSCVTSHLLATIPETENALRGQSAIADYLADIFKRYFDEYYANKPGNSKVIWDIAAVAYLLNPAWVAGEYVPSPILTDRLTWSRDGSRHLVKFCTWLDRDAIFRDLFAKVAKHKC